ncbi:MAG TPA: hypothetical protein VGB85_07780, partial [Nannocystis sp.]
MRTSSSSRRDASINRCVVVAWTSSAISTGSDLPANLPTDQLRMLYSSSTCRRVGIFASIAASSPVSLHCGIGVPVLSPPV